MICLIPGSFLRNSAAAGLNLVATWNYDPFVLNNEYYPASDYFEHEPFFAGSVISFVEQENGKFVQNHTLLNLLGQTANF
jgi:hypothetical protein